MWGCWPAPFITRFAAGPALVVHLYLAQLTILPATSQEQVGSALCLYLNDTRFSGQHSPPPAPPTLPSRSSHFGTSVSTRKKKPSRVTKYVYQQGNISFGW